MPRDLRDEIDELVGREGRVAFLCDAIREKLRDRRREESERRSATLRVRRGKSPKKR
jgi:Arc/MetJ-type ribon-helix-helix transcriptional regulator